jgi:hypothetical protein
MSDQIKSTKAHDSSADAKAVIDPAAILNDAPVYRVKEKSFLNDRLYDEGALVVYRGNPSDNLEPANALAEAAKAAYEAERAAAPADAAKAAAAKSGKKDGDKPLV